MEGAPLDSKELEAIREAMQGAAGAPGRATDSIGDDEVSPLSIIADDRAAVSARPQGFKLGERWARELGRSLRRLLGDGAEVEVAGCDAVDGPTLRDELAAMWTGVVVPRGRRGQAIVAVGGSLVEGLVARRFGDSRAADRGGRGPSTTALRLFTPVGAAVTDAMRRAWREEQACESQPETDPVRAAAARRAVTDTELLIAVTVDVRGEISGRVLCAARPETWVRPPAPVQAVPAPPGAIEDALGAVPIEVTVDLGRARMTRRELSQLRVGAVIQLGRFLDDLLPIECAGVVKAYGRAVVHRGVLSVEIADLSAAERRAA